MIYPFFCWLVWKRFLVQSDINCRNKIYYVRVYRPGGDDDDCTLIRIKKSIIKWKWFYDPAVHQTANVRDFRSGGPAIGGLCTLSPTPVKQRAQTKAEK